MPTNEDILVPETLLKKRKSQEKAREAKAAEIKERKTVSPEHFFGVEGLFGDDNILVSTRL